MSTDPASTGTVPSDPSPYQSGGAAADFAVSNRTTIAYILVVIGIACLGGGIYSLYKAYKAEESKKADTKKDGEITDPKKADEKPADDKAKLDKPHMTEYVLSGILGLMGAVAGFGVAAHTLSATPKLTYAESLTDARWTLLLAGGLIGFVLMVGGLTFAIIWFSSLTKALDDGKLSELKWVVGPLLVLLLGGGIVFLSAQPARAEERNNFRLRRMIYGTNFALTTLLLAVLLLVANVFATIKIPNKLDTTQGGHYRVDLNPLTREYIAGLLKTVTVYAIMPQDENPIITSTFWLLDACAEANPAKFKVRKLSPTLNRDEIQQLLNKYPGLDIGRNGYGLLFTIENDDQKAGFVTVEDLFRDPEARTQSSKITFKGESRVAQELLALTESKTKAIAYFTVGHGELEAISQPPQQNVVTTRRPAMALRSALEKSNVEVRPLEFDLANPKVPDDASVVIVADPRAPFPKDQAAAIEKFVTGPSKGKLVVLASPFPKPDGSGVSETGLEGVLAALSVELKPNYVLSAPSSTLGYSDLQTIVNPALVDSRNPIALTFRTRTLVLTNCREVHPLGRNPSGAFNVDLLLATFPPKRITWLESSPAANPGKTLQEFRSDASVVEAKDATDSRNRIVGVLVSEGSTSRAVVLGTGDAFADPGARGGPAAGANADKNAELLAASVNWLRDRPAVANIPGKTFGEYNPPKTADDVRIFWLPVGITLLGVIALGTGVWVSRRK